MVIPRKVCLLTALSKQYRIASSRARWVQLYMDSAAPSEHTICFLKGGFIKAMLEVIFEKHKFWEEVRVFKQKSEVLIQEMPQTK